MEEKTENNLVNQAYHFCYNPHKNTMLAAVGSRAASAVCRIAAARPALFRSAGAAAAGMAAVGTFCSSSHVAADALPELDDPVDYFKPRREHGAAM